MTSDTGDQDRRHCVAESDEFLEFLAKRRVVWCALEHSAQFKWIPLQLTHA